MIRDWEDRYNDRRDGGDGRGEMMLEMEKMLEKEMVVEIGMVVEIKIGRKMVLGQMEIIEKLMVEMEMIRCRDDRDRVRGDRERKMKMLEK